MIADTLLAALPASTGGGFVLFNPDELLPALGPWALAGISLMVFIESGVLFPFLPGDSLLFTAGVLHEEVGERLAEPGRHDLDDPERGIGLGHAAGTAAVGREGGAHATDAARAVARIHEDSASGVVLVVPYEGCRRLFPWTCNRCSHRPDRGRWS